MKKILLGLAALLATAPFLADSSDAASPRETVEAAYAAFAESDMEAFAGLMAPDIIWNEAEGNPYADLNPYVGPEAVMSGLISRLVADWTSLSVTPDEYVVDGNRVVVFGRYDQAWKATGRTIDIPFVHSWTVEDEQLVAFQQYTDTASLATTMAEPPQAEGGSMQPLADSLEQVSLFPADRSLVRPEDGVMLDDDRLLIADQRHGLVLLSSDGNTRPFGNFSAAGYVHEPPDRSAGPNGVSMEPDGIHVLVADVFTGAIYRVNTESERVELAYQHEFGANAARSDGSGAIWFTQSTKNTGPDSEARMFAAVDMRLLDGALFRVPPPGEDGSRPAAELKLSGLAFGNGLAIDEARGRIYVAEVMGDRIRGYRIDVESGELTEGRVVAEVPTPDNIELDDSGRLWVASPIANALLVVDPESGQWSKAFYPETAEHRAVFTEWQRRTLSGEPRLELIGPAMWSPLPGLLTGLILAPDGETVYLTGLGNTLVKLERQ